MSEEKPLSVGGLLVWLTVFLLAAAPMFAYLWETVNELLTGYFDPTRMVISIPMLVLFIGLVTLLTRQIRRWESRSTSR